MFRSWKSPHFFTGKPDVLHTDNQLSFSLPLINRGGGPANNLLVTDITLGPASLLVPVEFPSTLGDLAPQNFIPVNARFESKDLVYGGKYPIVISGTYQSSGATYQFVVDREITIPAQVPSPIEFLKARVGVAVKPGAISYNLINEERPGSPHYINAFSLEIFSPANVIDAPEGWEFETDHRSYVLWFTKGHELSNHDIAPGASLGGFDVRGPTIKSESRRFSLTAWNHESNEVGLVCLGSVPSTQKRGER